ncbi:hypothetical protein [Dactylosporangium sp. NPDC050588]|uniref:hypothetical protein n=1 Tax=Dactylosporangium sp. NPDC050588 TaxID=3157211 RepID=UPI0033FA915C
MLISIAQHAQPTASDQQTGTSSCLHLIRWDRYPGRPVIETESIRHVNPDGSGVLYQQTNAPQPTAATTTRFAAGELHSPIDEPIPTDPVRLNDAVTTATPPGSGSTAVVAVLLDLTSIRTLNLAERVAVIRVLAMLPGVELIAWVPGRGTGVGLQLRFSDGRGDPIDVITDQDTGEILGYRLEGPAALQSSTTTLILRRNRCDCPPPSRVMFVSAVRRSGFPPSAGCGIPSGVPTFRPAGAYEGARA